MLMQYHLEVHETLDSTQTYLRSAAAAARLPEWTVVRAVSQTGGLGQENNRWDSESGKNLTFSLLLYPSFLEPEKQFLLSQCIALGISDYIRVKGPLGTIKWPNDLYIGNKKTGGILLHNSIHGMELGSCIAGIGLNINQTAFADYCPNPTSLKAATAKDFLPEEELPLLLEALSYRYAMLREGFHWKINSDYLERLYRLGEWAEYSDAGGRFSGMIQGVDEYGRLVLQLVSGEQRTYDVKELRFH